MNSNSVFKKVMDFTSYGSPVPQEDPTPPTPLERAIDRLTRHDPLVNVDQLILQAVERAGTEAVNAKNQELKNARRADELAKSVEKLARVKRDVNKVLYKLENGMIYTTAEAKVANDTLKAASKALAGGGYLLRSAFGVRTEVSRRAPRIRGRHG